MDTALLRIFGLGAEPRERKFRARVVDSARMVYESWLLARSGTSLQHENFLRAARSNCGSRKKCAGIIAARNADERSLRKIWATMATARHVPADRKWHPHLYVVEGNGRTRRRCSSGRSWRCGSGKWRRRRTFSGHYLGRGLYGSA